MRVEQTTTKSLLLAIAVGLAACGDRGAADPGSNPVEADSSSAGPVPQLHVIQRAAFSYPYSCQPGGKLSYEGTALFLSAYSRQRNAPDLLYNGACGSPDYIEAATAGDDFALVADVGAVPLQDVSAWRAFNDGDGGNNSFVQRAPVIVGHTYVVLIAKSDIRALFVLHVDEQVADGPMAISFVVKSYAIEEVTESSPGFDWTSTNTGAGAPSSSSAAVAGSVSLGNGVTCGSDPSNDCRGLLYIGVIDKAAALPQATLLGSAVIAVADLSGGRKASYSIEGLPARDSFIAAMLVETGTPGNPPYPKIGDIVLAPQSIALQAGTAAAVDLVLPDRW